MPPRPGTPKILVQLVRFANVKLYLNSIKPSKRVLMMHPDNPKSGKLFSLCHGFKVCTSTRYLGNFIRNDNSKCYWLEDFTKKWEQNITKIIKTAVKYPDES